MKKRFLYIIGLFSFAAVLTSCNEEEQLLPSPISSLNSESRPGNIFLSWDMPNDSSVQYVKVSYLDHRTKEQVVLLSSVDTIVVPRTRQKYGEYSFQVQPYSFTNAGGEVLSIKETSGIAPIEKTETIVGIDLVAADLSTNAQEATEGPIANLLDGNKSTFFHTSWSASVPAPHWMQVNLPREINAFKFTYSRRNGNNRPTDFDLLGSTDGSNWELIKNITVSTEELASEDYVSSVVRAEKPFSKLKMSVNKTNTNSVFWTMSEFGISEVIVYEVDPEDPDSDY